MHKKIIFIWIGMLFLLLDIKICGIILYPPYEPFLTGAPNSVDMIIGHLIGNSVKIDIFSDIIGCLLILVPVGMLLRKSMKLSDGINQIQEKRPFIRVIREKKREYRAFISGILTLILYIGYQLMPFVLNGRERYQAGYFWYIVLALFKNLTFINAGLICCEAQENTRNHMWNSVVAIFILLSAFAGFIRAMCYFYDLPAAYGIYYAVQLFFSLAATVMYWKHRIYIQEEAA